MRKIIFCLSLALTVLALLNVSVAGTPTVLYNFCSQANCADGANPEADLVVDLSGNLWGTTRNGGANQFGTIFELTKSSGFTMLGQVYSFKGGTSDGAFPQAGLVLDTQTGFFVGTTSEGGTGSCTGGCGTLFAFVPGSTSDTILHFFGGSGDGATPLAGLLLDSSQNFYGTTSAGGSTANCSGGCGTVFSANPIGNTYKVLYKFTGSPTTADGADPVAALVFDSNGNLWGTAKKGGSKKFGTIFELASPSFTNLAFKHSFNGTPNGASPAAALTFDKSVGGALGTLYGTASAGGNRACTGGCGIVFELEISGHVIKIIYKLTGVGSGKTGAAPVGRLALETNPNDPAHIGHLYGTASQGGIITGSCPSTGCGTLFEICPPTISCTGFARGSLVFPFDSSHGANPPAGVLLDVPGADELYGARSLDGLSARELGEDAEPGPQTGKGACTTNCIAPSANGGTKGKGTILKVGP
jgi:uncharacterized repeat protein (TIGR03803 family)